MDVTREGRVTASLGGIGSGKSFFVKQRLREEKPQRLLIFDPEGEYGEFGHVTSNPSELIRAVQHNTFAIVWYPADSEAQMRHEFDAVARVSWDLLKIGGRPHTFVVDELQQVTEPGQAPDAWGKVVRRGRKYGATVYGAAQRPAEIDKTVFSLATEIRVGNLGYDGDQRVIAQKIGCNPAEIGALTGYECILWKAGEGIVARPKFSAGRPAEK